MDEGEDEDGDDRAKACFAPVVAPHTKLLILGSLPGTRSLALGRYYAHPQNQFWRLVGGVTGAPLETMDYPARIEALLRAGIGLWDVIASARRPGSLDSAIRAPMANGLAQFVATLPMVRAVAFNGGKAAAIGRKQLAGLPIATRILPSSSPAHAIAYARKAAIWSELASFLD